MSETFESLPERENGTSGGVKRLFRTASNTLIPAIIVIGGLLAFLALRWMKEGPQTANRVSQPPQVTTIQLQSAVSEFPIKVHGLVVPKREVTNAAEEAGKVTEKNPICEPGMFVKAGTLLLELDARRYYLEERRLSAENEQTTTDLAQLDVEEENLKSLITIAEEDLSLAEREVARFEQLAKNNVATESQLDTAVIAAVKARNALRTIKNSLALIPTRRKRFDAQRELNSARIEQARDDKAKTLIMAPFDGMISEEGVEQGDFAQVGQMLVKIEDTSAMEVKCNLRTTDLFWLRASSAPSTNEQVQTGEWYHEIPHALADVVYQIAGNSYLWKGELSRYEGVGIDQDTRTVPCRVEVSEPLRHTNDGGPRSLVRGMFVDVILKARPQVPLLEIPHAALRPQNQVWTVNDGQLHMHEVQVAKILPDVVLVHSETDGLRAGDQVVISPLSNGYDGMQVREKNETPLAHR